MFRKCRNVTDRMRFITSAHFLISYYGNDICLRYRCVMDLSQMALNLKKEASIVGKQQNPKFSVWRGHLTLPIYINWIHPIMLSEPQRSLALHLGYLRRAIQDLWNRIKKPAPFRFLIDCAECSIASRSVYAVTFMPMIKKKKIILCVFSSTLGMECI